jgi:hypothetical protein
MRSKCLSAVLFVYATSLSAQPNYEDRTGSISHVYGGEWEHFVGGGVAVFDCNGDRFPEVFAAGGQTPAVLLINQTDFKGGTLELIPETPDVLRLTGVTGAYPLDFNSDGHLDLVVLRAGSNHILRGGPDCSFHQTVLPGLEIDGRWTTSFSATWERASLLPTVAFGNYVDRTNPDGPFEACDVSTLHRPEGDQYGEAFELSPGFCALSMLFTDWRRLGRQDLRISNDRHYYVRGGEEQLWAMEDIPRLYGPEDGWQRYMLWGMGIASRDISGDGIPEVYLSSMGDQKLQMLDTEMEGPFYRDATYDRGTTAHRPHIGDEGRPSTGWHVAFGDVQNDGLDDIFIAKGNVDQMPGNAMEDPNSLLLQRPDGTFSEVSVEAGVASSHRGRGAALVDLNRDGLLDLVVVNRRAPMEISQNVTVDAGNWLSVEVSQPAPNVNAVGAWIEVDAGQRTQSREITVGGGHAGGAAVPEHFGLGDVESVRVRVIWPDGQASDWFDAETNAEYRIERREESSELFSY